MFCKSFEKAIFRQNTLNRILCKMTGVLTETTSSKGQKVCSACHLEKFYFSIKFRKITSSTSVKDMVLTGTTSKGLNSRYIQIRIMLLAPCVLSDEALNLCTLS